MYGMAWGFLGHAGIAIKGLLRAYKTSAVLLLCNPPPSYFLLHFPSVSWDQDRLWGVVCRVVSRDGMFSWHVLALSQILWGSPPVHQWYLGVGSAWS